MINQDFLIFVVDPKITEEVQLTFPFCCIKQKISPFLRYNTQNGADLIRRQNSYIAMKISFLSADNENGA